MTSDPVPAVFTAEMIQRQVADLCAGVEPGHGTCQIEYRLTDGTVRVDVAHRVNDHWSVQGSLAWHLRSGKVAEGSIRVRGSWGD